MVDDTARADIALTPERTYYRFATDSSIEDGELRKIDDFESIALDIKAKATALDGEENLPEGIRMQLFVDNRLFVSHQNGCSEQSLSRIIHILTSLLPEFEFLRGFIA